MGCKSAAPVHVVGKPRVGLGDKPATKEANPGRVQPLSTASREKRSHRFTESVLRTRKHSSRMRTARLCGPAGMMSFPVWSHVLSGGFWSRGMV